jgi:uncharacterized membrane protein
MEDEVWRAADILSLVAEAIGTVVIFVALVRMVVRYAADLVARVDPFPRDRLRLNLGRSLALTLELLLAADILRTAVDPNWGQIQRLAAIAAIRTGHNFVLQREIGEEEQRAAPQGDPARRATRLAPEPTTTEPARDR